VAGLGVAEAPVTQQDLLCYYLALLWIPTGPSLLFREEAAIYAAVSTAQQKPGSRDQLHPCSRLGSAVMGRRRELFDASSEAKAGTKLRWLLSLLQQMILSCLKCLFQLMYVVNSLALVFLYGLLQIQLQTLFSCHSWNCSEPNIMLVRVLFCSPCSPRCP